MIQCDYDTERHEGVIVLRPAWSGTWQANALIIGSLAVLGLGTAARFAWSGVYVIAPFILIEIAALTGSLWYCLRRASLREVLRLSPETVVLETGHHRPETRETFTRFYARFEVEPPRQRWYSRTIYLRAQGCRREIGSFLNTREKTELIAQLRYMIRRLDDATSGRQFPASATTDPAVDCPS